MAAMAEMGMLAVVVTVAVAVAVAALVVRMEPEIMDLLPLPWPVGTVDLAMLVLAAQAVLLRMPDQTVQSGEQGKDLAGAGQVVMVEIAQESRGTTVKQAIILDTGELVVVVVVVDSEDTTAGEEAEDNRR